MSLTGKPTLAANTVINAPIGKVWELWTAPKDIMAWNTISHEWHNTKVENDVRAGGKFLFAMALKDGSFGFDFCGTYTDVQLHRLIAYTLDDGRKSTVTFTGTNPVTITETFEPNDTDPAEMQKKFCQAVLNNFKRYVEAAE